MSEFPAVFGTFLEKNELVSFSVSLKKEICYTAISLQIVLLLVENLITLSCTLFTRI